MDERERDYINYVLLELLKKIIIIPLPLFFLSTNNKIVKFIFFKFNFFLNLMMMMMIMMTNKIMARNFRIISDADEDDDNKRGKSNKGNSFTMSLTITNDM